MKKNRLFLSKRLQILASFAKGAVADVGCGHGHLSIYLALNNFKKIYACDIKKGPLKTAMAEAKRFGVFSDICFMLIDGFKGLPKNLDTIIVAGMGGKSIVNMFVNVQNIKNKNIKFILQPQSFFYYFRYNIYLNGFIIEKEIPIVDGGKIYLIFIVRYSGIFRKITLKEAVVGMLSKTEGGLNKKILHREYVKNRLILDGLKKGKTKDYIKIKRYADICVILKDWK